MRNAVINILLKLLNAVDKEYKYEPLPKNKYDTLKRMEILIDRVNGTMKQIPKKNYLWVDRDSGRSMLTLREFDVSNQKQIFPTHSNK